MNRFHFIIIGSVLTLFSSMVGLVLLPIRGLGNFEAAPDPETGELVPPPLSALEARGRDVYVSMGCMYCHSQQVHPPSVRTDIDRMWGERRTVPRDYMQQGVAQMGTMRTGPDLANIGARQPGHDWHYLNLYQPRAINEQSIMPPHPWLFEVVGEEARPGREGLRLPEPYRIPGRKVLPTDEARYLVIYLISLDQQTAGVD